MAQPTDTGPFLDFLLSRRSAASLVEPGPSPAQLAQILRSTATAPDHGQMRPFRLVVIEGEGRKAFGRALAAAAGERRPGLSPEKAAGIAAKAMRSPTSIVLIASPREGKAETWEQHATAACAGYAVVLAAAAVGVGAVWKSVPFTRGKALSALFGMTDTEDMFGWIHLGTAANEASSGERPGLDVSAITTVIDRDDQPAG